MNENKDIIVNITNKSEEIPISYNLEMVSLQIFLFYLFVY